MRLQQRPGETFDQTRGRAFAVIEDCDFGLLLQMGNADAVQLACDTVKLSQMNI